METVQIAIVGGSGLYDMADVTDRKEVSLDTPFGEPSGPYVLGTLRGTRVAFLARHGAGHRLSPSELNFRANIYGFKTLGVERLLSASAVGSLREDMAPLHLVIPDQFIEYDDRTFDKARLGQLKNGFARRVCIGVDMQESDGTVVFLHKRRQSVVDQADAGQ